MKIQRSDRQNKVQTDKFSSIDKILKTSTSNIKQTSDSNRGALIQEIASRMNRPYESDIRLFTLDQIFLWIRWQDIIVYQTDQWNELIDYISRSDIERRAYKEVIYSLKSQISQKENKEDKQKDKEQEDKPEHPVKNNRLKVIDNNESENIDQVKRIEDLYKKPLDINNK